MAGMGAASTIEQAESIVSTEIAKSSFAEGGEFLPLKVWDTRGCQIANNIAPKQRQHRSWAKPDPE